MNHETIAAYIADGKAVLGIEFGSTRIKAATTTRRLRPATIHGRIGWRTAFGRIIWMTYGRACRTRSRICKRTCRRIMA
jgi:hypothetical protein